MHRKPFLFFVCCSSLEGKEVFTIMQKKKRICIQRYFSFNKKYLGFKILTIFTIFTKFKILTTNKTKYIPFKLYNHFIFVKILKTVYNCPIHAQCDPQIYIIYYALHSIEHSLQHLLTLPGIPFKLKMRKSPVSLYCMCLCIPEI